MAEKPTPRDDSRDDRDSVRAISVRGFKCFAAESRIEIRPLTILAGANSSGKSSIMQPLLMMKQPLETTYDLGAFLLSGPNAKQTAFEQLVSRRSIEAPSPSASRSMQLRYDPRDHARCRCAWQHRNSGRDHRHGFVAHMVDDRLLGTEPELVRLHWFTPEPVGGSTSIQSADLDESGAFGDWPEDFGDVELSAEGAYLDAVETRIL